jgi:hypothetical protein
MYLRLLYKTLVKFDTAVLSKRIGECEKVVRPHDDVHVLCLFDMNTYGQNVNYDNATPQICVGTAQKAITNIKRHISMEIVPRS